MKIIALSDVQKAPVAMAGASRAWKQTPVSAADGAPNFSFRVFTLEPGGHTPHHEHPFEHVNYVIGGAGALVSPDGRSLPLRAGDFALVLPGEKHQYRNASDTEPFVMICAVPKAYE